MPLNAVQQSLWLPSTTVVRRERVLGAAVHYVPATLRSEDRLLGRENNECVGRFEVTGCRERSPFRGMRQEELRDVDSVQRVVEVTVEYDAVQAWESGMMRDVPEAARGGGEHGNINEHGNKYLYASAGRNNDS